MNESYTNFVDDSNTLHNFNQIVVTAKVCANTYYASYIAK